MWSMDRAREYMIVDSHTGRDATGDRYASYEEAFASMIDHHILTVEQWNRIELRRRKGRASVTVPTPDGLEHVYWIYPMSEEDEQNWSDSWSDEDEEAVRQGRVAPFEPHAE